MNTLILTVGLPRSGKSTWANSTELPIVNPDSIRLALHNNAFIPEAEPMVWCIARYMIKALFLAGHSYVILDATNITTHRRKEWNSKEWDTKYMEFHTPEEICIQRAEDSGKPELIPVIKRMAEQYEPLNETEKERIL